jgi:hypothetical protein
MFIIKHVRIQLIGIKLFFSTVFWVALFLCAEKKPIEKLNWKIFKAHKSRSMKWL